MSKYPHIHVKLTDGSGNAFEIIGAIRVALKRGGVAKDEIDAFTKEAMSGDHDHVLQTAMATVNVT